MSKTIEQFFKPVCGDGSSSSKEVPAAAVLAAQKEMEKIAKAGQKRGACATISEELKAKVAKYAAENGVSARNVSDNFATLHHGHSKGILSATCLPAANQRFSLRCSPDLLIHMVSAHATRKTERCRHLFARSTM